MVPNVTEGMYIFIEESVAAPVATLLEPVIVHVDQAAVDGGGTVKVYAALLKGPPMSIAIMPPRIRPSTTRLESPIPLKKLFMDQLVQVRQQWLSC